jgi:hypothetical protein
MGNTLPKTTWWPCLACLLWRVGPFWGSMDLQKFWSKLFDHRIVELIIGNKGCNCRFNVFFSVWCVIEFRHLSMHLHLAYNTLQIMRLAYQWSLDFASSLSLTPWRNWYVLVMIEHFSKWLELVPLLDLNSERASYALNKYGT